MNFTYLKTLELPKGLYEACREAELFAKTFPTASLSSARRAGEFAVKMVYGALVDEQSIYGMTVFDMLSDIRDCKLITDPRWFNAAHSVRRSGNLASHQGEGDVQGALTILADLYDEIGIALRRLGLIGEYPPFDLSLVPETTDEPVPKTEIEIELSKEFLEKVHSSNRRHFSKKAPVPVDVEKNNVKDLGFHSKTALHVTTQYLEENKPEWNIQNDPRLGLISISSTKGKTIILAVKSGCPPLGKRINGVMEFLPGIDFVAYAPSFSTEKTYVEQLRFFTKEDFLAMWNKLGLIRAKVAKGTYERLKQELPPDTVISQDIYADSVTVQSFSNSGKKTRLLNEELEKRPMLSREGLKTLESALK